MSTSVVPKIVTLINVWRHVVLNLVSLIQNLPIVVTHGTHRCLLMIYVMFKLVDFIDMSVQIFMSNKKAFQ